MLADGAIDIGERETRELLAYVLVEVWDAVVAAVERVAELGVLRLREQVDVL